MGLLGLILVKILAPGFYARQIMATPVKIAFATVLVSQTLALILMFPLGHAGLTLSTSIGACLNAALLFWFLRKRGIYRPSAGWLMFVAKLVVALFALAAVLLWLGRAGVVLALGVAVGEGRPARGRVRRGRGRVFRRAVAAGIPPAPTSTAGTLQPRRERARAGHARLPGLAPAAAGRCAGARSRRSICSRCPCGAGSAA